MMTQWQARRVYWESKVGNDASSDEDTKKMHRDLYAFYVSIKNRLLAAVHVEKAKNQQIQNTSNNPTIFYKGITLIAKRSLELKSLKHSETRILIGNGYIPMLNTYFHVPREITTKKFK